MLCRHACLPACSNRAAPDGAGRVELAALMPALKDDWLLAGRLQGAAALLLRFGAIHTCPVPPAIPAAILAAMPPEQAAQALARRQEALRRAGNSVSGALGGHSSCG